MKAKSLPARKNVPVAEPQTLLVQPKIIASGREKPAAGREMFQAGRGTLADMRGMFPAGREMIFAGIETLSAGIETLSAGRETLSAGREMTLVQSGAIYVESLSDPNRPKSSLTGSKTGLLSVSSIQILPRVVALLITFVASTAMPAQTVPGRLRPFVLGPR